MEFKPEAPIPGLIEELKRFEIQLDNGISGRDRNQAYASLIDSIEHVCGHYFDDTEFTDGLMTDRYWHVMQETVPDDVYGTGVFNRELKYQAARLKRLRDQLESVQEVANAGEGTIAVPDTNIFVHCGEMSAIDWRSAVGAESVRVVVPLVVVNELDELKYMSRDKPERFAVRTNLRQLRDALRANQGKGAVRLSDGVTLAILPDPRGHRRLPVNDEEICSRAALLKSFHPSTVLVSNDLGAQVRSWGFTLETVEVPEIEPK